MPEKIKIEPRSWISEWPDGRTRNLTKKLVVAQRILQTGSCQRLLRAENHLKSLESFRKINQKVTCQSLINSQVTAWNLILSFGWAVNRAVSIFLDVSVLTFGILRTQHQNLDINNCFISPGETVIYFFHNWLHYV